MEAGVMGLIVTSREVMNKVLLGFILITALLISSCEIPVEESKWDKNKDLWQVYGSDEETIGWNTSMVAEPYKSFGFSSSQGRPEVPWTLTGEIRDGYFRIDFPNDLELWDVYGEGHPEGVRVARVHIKPGKDSSTYLTLHTIDGKYESSIDMFYIVGEVTYHDVFTGYTYFLKTGWNFIDKVNGNVYHEVYDLLELGYRWQVEYSVCC